MFLSIIVSIYNIENYIDMCVKSLMQQGSADYEVILVDDGSTDRGGEIADRWARKSALISAVHKANGGLSDARNVGLEKARGDYVWFVDGDDFVAEFILSSMKRRIEEQERPDVVFLESCFIYGNGERKRVDSVFKEDQIVGRTREEVLAYISNMEKYPGAAWSKLYRKDFLIKYQLKFEYGKLSEDLDWTKNVLFSAEHFGTIGFFCYFYRREGQNSISGRFSYKHFLAVAELIDEWSQEAQERQGVYKEFLQKQACFEYKVLLLYFYRVERSCQGVAMEWLISHRDLLAYRDDKTVRLIRFIERFCGMRVVCLLLKMYNEMCRIPKERG